MESWKQHVGVDAVRVQPEQDKVLVGALLLPFTLGVAVTLALSGVLWVLLRHAGIS